MKKIVIILAIFLAIAIAGSATGFYTVYGRLNSTQSDLQLALGTVNYQKDKLEQNKQELSDLQSQLGLKDKELADINKRLDDAESLLDQANSEKDAMEVSVNSFKDAYKIS